MREDIKIKELKSFLNSIDIESRSYLNCYPINNKILQKINTEFGNNNLKVVKNGKICKPERRGVGGDEHSFIHGYVLEEERRKEVIVDGTLNQFSEENKRKGLVHNSVAPEDEIQDIVVLTKKDELFKYYFLP